MPLIEGLAFFVLRPSNLIAICLVVGLLLLLAQWRGVGVLLISAGTVAFVVCGFLPVGQALLRPLENRFPYEGYVIAPPEGIIMLGGVLAPTATIDRHMAVLTDAADRVVVVAELARRFPDSRIVVTDGPLDPPIGAVSGARVIASLFREFGIEDERIILEPQARNTWQNATFTKAVIDPKPDARWVIVTSAWHMPRAIGAFRAAGWTGLVPWPVDYRTDRSSLLEAVTPSAAHGLYLTNLAVREYLALAYYRLTGRSSALLPAPDRAG